MLWDWGTARVVLIGEIKSEIPKMRPMFAMLDPMMFPRINPGAPLVIAAMEVKSSGAEVAIETTVKPTTTLGIPTAWARFEQ
jgi:hypothetical protein